MFRYEILIYFSWNSTGVLDSLDLTQLHVFVLVQHFSGQLIYNKYCSVCPNVRSYSTASETYVRKYGDLCKYSMIYVFITVHFFKLQYMINL